jgi:hypothetical protein
MKKLIVIFTLFCSLTSFSQNGLTGKYFMLLKSDKVASLNTLEDHRLKEYRTFEITSKSIYTTDKNNKVAILDTAQNKILLHDLTSQKDTELSIPFDIKPKTILLAKHNLFIGGEKGKEILIQYNINDDKWFKLEIPEEVQMWGKAVDDLVINDSLLIAIDNIVLPKYVLFYSLDSTEKLELSYFEDLKSNGPYESIHAGRITSKYLGLISDSYSGYTGASEHITIYDKLNLKRSFAISIGQQEEGFHTFNDFVIIGDKLFISSKEKGLGVFDIRDSYFKVSKDRFDNFNEELSIQKIRYKSYSNVIIKLTLSPDNQKLILTTKNIIGRISHEVIDI